MQNSTNPYAPPRSASQTADPASGSISRDGKILLLQLPGTVLPHRCVKCNAEVGSTTDTVKLYWHSPFLYLLILLNIIIYAIVAAIAGKSAKVALSLCPEHRKTRNLGKWLIGGSLVFGLGLIPVAVVNDLGSMALLGIFAAAVAMVVGVVLRRTLSAQRIDDRQIRVKGCGPAFLDSFNGPR